MEKQTNREFCSGSSTAEIQPLQVRVIILTLPGISGKAGQGAHAGSPQNKIPFTLGEPFAHPTKCPCPVSRE